MPRPVRRLLSAIALAVMLGVAGGLALPGAALAASPDAPVAVAPAEGSFVEPGAVVLEWTAVDAPQGYEVSWAAEGGENAGTAATAQTTVTIDVESGSFSWRVRALPDGEWSAPASFHADLDLPTLPLPDQPAAPAAAPQGLEAIPGGVWIVGALAFSVVFLAVVVVQSRIGRERDA